MYSLKDLLTNKEKMNDWKFVPFPDVLSDSDESIHSNQI